MQAIALTGGLASQHQSRVTVLLVDDQALEQDPSIARMDFLSTCAASQSAALDCRQTPGEEGSNFVTPESHMCKGFTTQLSYGAKVMSKCRDNPECTKCHGTTCPPIVLLLKEAGHLAKCASVFGRTLKQQGCHSFEVVDQVSPVSSSAAIGDVADQVDATLLVMSTEVRTYPSHHVRNTICHLA